MKRLEPEQTEERKRAKIDPDLSEIMGSFMKDLLGVCEVLAALRAEVLQMKPARTITTSSGAVNVRVDCVKCDRGQ
ncbi:hypothetical protein DPX16_2249 [Anabarilius grahami]|uniref:Uncharacterized protein n=1 Tax=Anabarilius grahami TaxID=495550 RepID=A0A3N0YRS4_ANAGA|nr:hypothetical protein DPX16_2249 [Anabarilius grahami]